MTPHDELFGTLHGKNLVVLQVEAMQEWVIGTRVNGAEITPFLNRLKNERALYFSGVWDLTGISPTADCEYLSMNSQHPLANAAVVFKYADNHFVALPGVFANAGYDTLAMHAFERGFWNRARVYPSYGFRHMLFEKELGYGERFGWGLSDKAFFAKTLTNLDAAKKPFYALLITLTSHHPYTYLPASQHRIDTSGLPKMLADYVASIHYVDEALAAFFTALERRDYAKDTVVAIYGDHESRLVLDRDGEAAAKKALSLDEKTIADLARRSFATRKVPFFVVPPALSAPKTFERIGGQIDFAPTILHLFGLEKPLSMLGRALVEGEGSTVRFDGSGVDAAHVRQGDGSCRTRAGATVPPADCADIARRADEEVQISWTITEHDLAAKLSHLPNAGKVH
jgi:phosphoglycerol transferase MdoB-like AlkP superfamily enzyme